MKIRCNATKGIIAIIIIIMVSGESIPFIARWIASFGCSEAWLYDLQPWTNAEAWAVLALYTSGPFALLTLVLLFGRLHPSCKWIVVGIVYSSSIRWYGSAPLRGDSQAGIAMLIIPFYLTGNVVAAYIGLLLCQASVVQLNRTVNWLVQRKPGGRKPEGAERFV